MRRKLFLALWGTALLGIAVVVGVLRASTQRQVHAFVAQGGPWGLQQTVARLQAYYAQRGSWEGVEAALRAGAAGGSPGHALEHGPRVVLVDAQGRVLFPPEQAGRTWTPEEQAGALPLRHQGRVVGYLVPPGALHVAAATRDLLHRLDWAALMASAVAVAAAAGLSWWLSRRVLRPIYALTRAAQRLAQGDLSVRVPEGGDDELRTLARTFNHMAQALQQAAETRQRMLADIAHELRTPLAVQQAHLEALQDGLFDLTPENLAPVVEQNRLLARLVDDLRTLTLADSGQLPLETQRLDLRTWLPEVVEPFRAAARQRGVALRLTLPPEPLPVQADPARLAQILNNLLGNALRYTPQGGLVEVGAVRKGAQAHLWVRDTGPGLPSGEEERVFERFYRADKSRSRASGGSGLGLSIARSLARAHGGDLTAHNHPEGGAVFSLQLPAAPEAAPDAPRGV